MPQVHVIRTQTVPDPNPARAGQPTTWVTYQVEGGSVASTFIPKLNPTEAEISEAIKAAERVRTSVEGRSITI